MHDTQHTAAAVHSGSPEERPAPRSTGRPTTIDPEAVARVALRLFADQGYERTSMEDVARAAGVGRKSLYRYFDSKADLVWGGIEASVGASQRALAEQPAAGDLLAALRHSVIAVVPLMSDPEMARARLRLIAELPELANRSNDALAPQYDAARAHLVAHGVREDTADYLSAALIGATFAAWTRWAAGSDPDPTPYLLASLDVLALPRSTSRE